MPSEQSVWRHQGVDLEKPLSADCFGLDCESTTLLISETQSLPTQLLTQGSILRL
jgi:hypothetical protein